MIVSYFVLGRLPVSYFQSFGMMGKIISELFGTNISTRPSTRVNSTHREMSEATGNVFLLFSFTVPDVYLLDYEEIQRCDRGGRNRFF